MVRTGVDTWRSHPGGSTWNAARAMAGLGVPSAFAGAVSADLFGADLLKATGDAGLDPRFLQQVDKPPLLAVVHELDPPSYFFIGADSADLHFDPYKLPAGWQVAVEWAHFGGISLAREPLAGRLVALARELKAQGVRISYDPNFRSLMDARYDATLATMTALADVVKVSDEDLRGLFRCADADAAFARLRAMNPQAMFLYTRGAEGASLHMGAGAWHARPPPIEVVDTVGAGDASLAGLVTSLMLRPGLEGGAHLAFSVAAGAAACTVQGAAPVGMGAVDALAALVEAKKKPA
ncbi:carbohydrate kinase family protein [Massilia sp. SYSU DXS3249]